MITAPKTNRQTPKVYPPVGSCIYCGADGGKKGLSREHIIADGLQGSMILQKASCSDCARTTSRIETLCLQRTYVDYRDLANLRMSKRSKAKHKRRRVVALMLPDLSPPEILSGDPIEVALHRCDPRVAVKGMNTWYLSRERLFALNEEDRPKTFNIDSFMRMLAKIAHSFAIAELGINNVSSDLADIILGTAPNEKLHYRIGGAHADFTQVCLPAPEGMDQNDPPLYTLHQLYLAPQVTLSSEWQFSVGIRLFAIHKTPLYQVAVGLMKPSPEFLARVEPAGERANP